MSTYLMIMGLPFLAVCSNRGKLVRSAEATLKKGTPISSKRSTLSSSQPDAVKRIFCWSAYSLSCVMSINKHP